MKQQNTKTKKNNEPWETTIGRRRIRIADIREPSDSRKTAKQLQADIEQAGPATVEPAERTVARGDIHVAEQVFQWRDSDQWDRRNHIHRLAKAIKEQGRPLPHLLVLPVGQRFYVIDGHHRLAGYDTAEWTKRIPVRVFPGDLTTARLLALSCNVRDKLPMTTKAKSDAAWQIVKENLGGLTAQEIADRTGISLRQVKYMKAAWKELPAALAAAAKAAGKEPVDPMELTWAQARDVCQGKTAAAFTDEERETWKQRKAQEMVDLIQRTNVAAGIMKDMEVTALALQMLDGGLPAALMEQWAGDYSEEIEELAARIAMPDNDPF
ncbi:ParB-like chromosome segregation protein Spo0J [Bradyrhizobium sp. USDA 4463]